MNESGKKTIYKNPINPKESKIFSDKGVVNIDDGSEGGSHWTCFIKKGKKSNYYDSFGGNPDNFLLNQLPKPMIYHD